MLWTFSGVFISTVSFLKVQVVFNCTEPLEKMIVPPIKVQLVQVTLELTVRTTPGSRVIVQPLQLLIPAKADVDVLMGMVWDLAVAQKPDKRNTVDRRVIKGRIGMGRFVYDRIGQAMENGAK